MIYKVSVRLHRDFIEVNGDEITVGVLSPPQKGKANKELIEKISSYFKVPKASVSILSGAGSRKKMIEVI
ncbi:MAG: DUF167 domain-containing protein [Candidatus Aenigmarchaeota archaeon]|nr:DUF167 domain-containing protein [Candidatus Aenigmarchaeota archaeon]